MAKPPSEADVIFNRVNVALARQQRLVASWLPPPTPQELAKKKTEEELEKEDQEIFKFTPELLGVGAKPPPDDGKGWSSRTSTDILRRKLLGNHARAAPSPQQQGKSQRKAQPQKATAPEDESDSDDGRAALLSSKRGLKTQAKGGNVAEGFAGSLSEPVKDNPEVEAAVAEDETAAVLPTRERIKRKATSFLDDMLEEKAKKRKKKKKKNKGSEAQEGS